jgi:lipopolysaccharide biosynthesis protein
LYCREAGVGELFLMSTHAFDNRDPRDFGFDAALEFAPNNMPVSTITAEMTHVNPGYRGYVHDYRYLVESNLERKAPDGYPLFRSVTPMWDNEARRPSSGTVYANSSPELYRTWLTSVCRWTERYVDVDKPFVFVNAWNEWAEGAHLEPDRRYGYAYLQATAEALERFPVR